eukprot:TRINITY_DN7136_c0_g4_i1.p1 TRINITY_DN7136_c0_g4~~TRINITY_DN7136_c0_g4_i1.p1  ORF type:complete len:541 (+),score=89.17 TRINITY_DN7136_c0_g4_i1:254-1876(+)
MKLLLTDAHIKELSLAFTNISETTLLSCFRSPDSLSHFTVDQLKVLIRYLKKRLNVDIKVTGTKAQLIKWIAPIIWVDDEPLAPPSAYPTPSSYPLSPVTPHTPQHHHNPPTPGGTVLQTSKLLQSIIHSQSQSPFITQPPSSSNATNLPFAGFPLSQTKPRSLTPLPLDYPISTSTSTSSFVLQPIQPMIHSPSIFTSPHFLLRQSPFFDPLSTITTHQFYSSPMLKKFSFEVDRRVLDRNPPHSLFHLRFYSPERLQDIPWNTDVKININGFDIDILPLARKIRSKAYKDPFIVVKPLDLTLHIRMGTNIIEFQHPGESGVVVVQIVRPLSTQQLTERLLTGPSYQLTSPDKWLQQREREIDDELSEVNFMLSVRCPLSLAKISIPARGSSCKHIQCFDLAPFLDYSQQQQLFHCPICHNRLPFNELIIDGNFKMVLASITDDEIQHIVIEKDGSWSVPTPSSHSLPNHLKKHNSPLSPTFSQALQTQRAAPILDNSTSAQTTPQQTITLNQSNGVAFDFVPSKAPPTIVIIDSDEEG